MPAFNTPHGIFDTSFFAIAESLPKRLLKDSESKPAVYSDFDAQEDHIHLHIEEEAFQAMLKNELGKAKQPCR